MTQISPRDWQATCIREVSRQFIGQPAVTGQLCTALVAGLHVLVEDVPGTGKTTLAKAFARACGLDMGRIQCTPDLLPGDVLGMLVYDREAGDFRFRPGAIMHSMVYADELNRSPTRTQAAFLEAMEEACITVENRSISLPEPFFLMATQNPQGFAGTFPLPEAQLDRFGLRFSLGYPDEAQELAILELGLAGGLARPASGSPPGRPGAAPSPEPEPVPAGQGAARVLALRAQAAGVTVHPAVTGLVSRILRQSRTHHQFRTGFPPRAGVHLVKAARARALLDGRDYCTPDDVVALAPTVLAHRVILSPEARVAGVSREAALDNLLADVPRPLPRI